MQRPTSEDNDYETHQNSLLLVTYRETIVNTEGTTQPPLRQSPRVLGGRNKTLPSLPPLAIPENLVALPSSPRGSPFPLIRGFSSTIPYVESTGSTSSGRSTRVSEQEPAFQRTQEWREYRNSLAIQAESGVAIGVPIPTRASPGMDSSDRLTPGTSVEEASSTDGIFYRRTQLPVHAVDTLRVIADNLEVLGQEDFTRRYHATLERAHRYITQVIQTLEFIPRQVVTPPTRVRNFAEYLQNQIDYLRAKVINPENYADIDLEENLRKFRSCLRARELHQAFLRQAQRV